MVRPRPTAWYSKDAEPRLDTPKDVYKDLSSLKNKCTTTTGRACREDHYTGQERILSPLCQICCTDDGGMLGGSKVRDTNSVEP